MYLTCGCWSWHAVCGEEASVSVSGAGPKNTGIKIPVFDRDGLDQCSEL